MLKSQCSETKLDWSFNGSAQNTHVRHTSPLVPVILYYKDKKYPALRADVQLHGAGANAKLEAFVALHGEIIRNDLKFLWTHIGFGDDAPLISKEEITKAIAGKKIHALHKQVESPDINKYIALKHLHAQSGFQRF